MVNIPATFRNSVALQLAVKLVKYWCAERVLGFGLLFYAGITAFTAFQQSSTMAILVKTTGVNFFTLSLWYLLSALYILYKGEKIGLAAFALCTFPLNLQTLSDLLFALERVDGGYIAREVLLFGVIFQMMFVKLVNETMTALKKVVEEESALKSD